ncbi:putative AAA domain-containing protein [Candidatus Hepatincolaceae symbiont of Richtersius coronifer]
MTKIIVFSGSHGVGKTSLVKRIAKEFVINHSDSKIKIFNEINSGFYKIGLALNGKGYDFDEVMFSQQKAFDLGYEIIKYYLTRSYDNRTILMDRSCIDTLIYSNYFINKNQQTAHYQEMLDKMYLQCAEIIDKVQHILVPPFNDFESLDERMNVQERDEIWKDFITYFTYVPKYSKMLTPQTTELRYKEIFPLLGIKH